MREKNKQTCIYDTHLSNKYNACGHRVESGRVRAGVGSRRRHHCRGVKPASVESCSPLWPLQALLVCSLFTLKHKEKIFTH